MVVLNGAKEKKPLVHLAFCADANYVPWFGTTLTSLLHNNPKANLHVHLLAEELPPADLEKLRILADLHCIVISIYDIDQAQMRRTLDGFFLPKHISQATYYRLFLATILPKEVRKVLYLDCDMLVLGPIAALYQTDLGDSAVGAVEETLTGPGYADRIGIPGKPYFNAGMLLIDLDKWRKASLLKAALGLLSANPELMLICDQDALNKYFAGDFLRLNRKWNSFINAGFAGMNTFSDTSVIVHFVGACKPWFPWYDGPLKELYLKYLRRSLWSDMPLPEPGTSVEAFAYASLLARNGKYEEASRLYVKVANAMDEEISRLKQKPPA